MSNVLEGCAGASGQPLAWYTIGEAVMMLGPCPMGYTLTIDPSETGWRECEYEGPRWLAGLELWAITLVESDRPKINGGIDLVSTMARNDGKAMVHIIARDQRPVVMRGFKTVEAPFGLPMGCPLAEHHGAWTGCHRVSCLIAEQCMGRTVQGTRPVD